MTTTQTFVIDSTVRVLRCEACSSVVGKTAKFVGLDAENEEYAILSFGRGRPPLNRPKRFPINDLEMVINDG